MDRPGSASRTFYFTTLSEAVARRSARAKLLAQTVGHLRLRDLSHKGPSQLGELVGQTVHVGRGLGTDLHLNLKATVV